MNIFQTSVEFLFILT